MKHFPIIFTILCFAALKLCYAQTTQKTEPSEQTITQLKKFRTDIVKALLQKKPDLIEPFYSERARLMPAFQKSVMGKANVALYYKAFTNRFLVNDFTRNELEILDLGEQVIEIGNLTMKLKNRTTMREIALSGKYMNIWEKSKAGELLLITEAWNYDENPDGVYDMLRFEDVPSINAATLPNVYVNSNISFELAALNRLLDATVTQHDANVWSFYYAEDAILMPGNHPICRGKKEVKEYLNIHAKELPVFEELDIRNDHIDNLGTFVIEYASHIASWRSGQSSGVGMGKNIRVWRREADHSLKMFRSIGMYD